MKNIIFCADGTWNGPGEADQDDPAQPPTNVFKLFLNLSGANTPDTLNLAKEQEKTLPADGDQLGQHAKYLHGVGDSSNFLVHLLGGSLGAGLITRVVRGYTFISRVYQPNDRIFIVGFSRGAYTARALAGMIANQGLMQSAGLSKEQAYRAGAAIWYEYRKMASVKGWLAQLTALLIDLPAFLMHHPDLPPQYRVPIEAVAVWDTVGALGIPAYTVTAGRLDAFQFADTVLSPVVAHGFQAVALDERRSDFTPTLWTPDKRITQLLFPGAHADVGGGEAAVTTGGVLSDCALLWMTEELSHLDLRFDRVPAPGQADPCGIAHQPWTDWPWRYLPQGARNIPAGIVISDCLRARYASPAVQVPPDLPAPYRPTNLPPGEAL